MTKKGKKMNDYEKRNIVAANKKRKPHPNSLANLKIIKKGDKLSPEHYKNTVESIRKRDGFFKKGNQINKGRNQTPEQKLATGKRSKQLWEDVDYRNKIYIKIIFGERTRTPEAIAKFVKTRTENDSWNKKGMHSKETIEKCREARLHQIFPSQDSKIEKKLQIALSLEGIKFEKHKPITGQPDIFIEPNLCVFVDGCYFHGCEICCKDRINDPIPQKNLIRDAKVNQELNSQGYQVIRVRQHDINRNVKRVADNIIDLIKIIYYSPQKQV